MNQDMSPEIGRRPQASAGGKQKRAADGPECILQESFGVTVAWRRAGVADCDIGIAGPQVDDAVRPNHVEWRITTQLSPARQPRHQPSAGECVRRRHAQRLAIAMAPDRAESGGKCFEAVADHRKQTGARLRQRQWPRPAAEQRSPAILLQQSDLMAHRRRRDAELGGGLLETHVPRRRFERAQLDERRQPVHAANLDEKYSSSTEFFALARGAPARNKRPPHLPSTNELNGNETTVACRILHPARPLLDTLSEGRRSMSYRFEAGRIYRM